MSGSSAISMFAIFNYFKSNLKQLKKGELSFNAGYVCKIVYDSANGLIQGEVKASMKSIQYKVKVSNILLYYLLIIIIRTFKF